MKALLRAILRLLAFAMLGLMVWLGYASYPYWSAMLAPTLTDFSPQNWQAAHHYKRLELAQDFLDKHTYSGMSGDAVVALLGKPDYQSPHSLTYLLSFTAADFMALSFELDDQGRVERARIHQT